MPIDTKLELYKRRPYPALEPSVKFYIDEEFKKLEKVIHKLVDAVGEVEDQLDDHETRIMDLEP